ncbi:uncharacterized protein LOC142223089 [Haematobia irritans]|uniref:uncharacterized protein LOC142223089 n=1 Tax=Haematobia irritans TaxID=7368 RepID=UPI003F4F69B5
MSRNYLIGLVFSLILLSKLKSFYCLPNRGQGKTLTDPALTDDIKWLFRGIGNFAHTVERMLPDVQIEEKNKTFGENTRLSLLTGMRHVLVGVREISTTFEQSLKTDHIKQLQQFKNAANFVNDIISTLKMWLNHIRAMAVHFYTIYNRYIPEVLFGKCLGNYMVSKYPDRSFYEYPFLLLAEIYESVINNESQPQTATEEDFSATETNEIGDDLNMAQNEIAHGEEADGYNDSWDSLDSRRDKNSPKSYNVNEASSESFFDLSTVLSDDKDKIIDNAVEQESWQICLKLYTAESISRSLKSYFLNL